MKKENAGVTERTRIITAKITIIETLKPGEKDVLSKKEKIKQAEAQIKKAMKADNVKVSNVQDFTLAK